jgi:hypothetical protein
MSEPTQQPQPPLPDKNAPKHDPGDPFQPTTIPVSPVSRTRPVIRQRQTLFHPAASAILQVNSSGAVLSLSLDKPTLLGRGPGVDKDPSAVVDLSEFDALKLGISRHHCRLERRDQRLLVTDLGSTNGTFVNAEALRSHQEYALANGDTLTLGKLRLTVFFSK